MRVPLFLAPLLLLSSSLAHAHEGHGLFGSHWHATDTAGWIAALVAVAVGLWFYRK